jgi:hypothetical protein
MKPLLLALTLLALAGCASSSGPAQTDFNLLTVPKELDARGISFNVGRVPGEDALTFGVKFKIASEGEEEAELTEAAWMEAAQKAAPAGCTVASLTPTAEGGRKATYTCK